jgi:hypothetical protein
VVLNYSLPLASTIFLQADVQQTLILRRSSYWMRLVAGMRKMETENTGGLLWQS